MPPICSTSSIVSRVVPAISDTMARSSFNKAFSKVDLPAFGLPTIATGIPFLSTLPTEKEATNCVIVCFIWLRSALKLSLSAKATSSSAKSNSSSISEAKLSNSPRRVSISEAKPPRICCSATLCEASESEAIRSATASAWLSAILPLRKALLVNSPASAKRAPFAKQLFITWAMI